MHSRPTIPVILLDNPILDFNKIQMALEPGRNVFANPQKLVDEGGGGGAGDVTGKMARPRFLVSQLHSPLFDSGLGAQEGVQGVQGLQGLQGLQGVTHGMIYRGEGRQRAGARKEGGTRYL
jgi:hypothetical protein